MQDITVKGTELQKIIEDALPTIFKEKFSSSYSNPIATMIEEEIKSNDGAIKLFVRDTINSILNDEKFKDLVTKEVVGSIIAKGLSR